MDKQTNPTMYYRKTEWFLPLQNTIAAVAIVQASETTSDLLPHGCEEEIRDCVHGGAETCSRKLVSFYSCTFVLEIACKYGQDMSRHVLAVQTQLHLRWLVYEPVVAGGMPLWLLALKRVSISSNFWKGSNFIDPNFRKLTFFLWKQVS